MLHFKLGIFLQVRFRPIQVRFRNKMEWAEYSQKCIRKFMIVMNLRYDL